MIEGYDRGMILHRRTFMKGILALGCAPAIVRVGNIMPVKAWDARMFLTDENDWTGRTDLEAHIAAHKRYLDAMDQWHRAMLGHAYEFTKREMGQISVVTS